MTAGCAELSLTQTKSPARDAAEELVEGFRLAGRFMRDAKSTFSETQGIFPTLLSHLDTMEAERAEMAEMLREAALQIDYLHGKFQTTGTGETVLARIRMLLARIEPK